MDRTQTTAAVSQNVTPTKCQHVGFRLCAVLCADQLLIFTGRHCAEAGFFPSSVLSLQRLPSSHIYAVHQAPPISPFYHLSQFVGGFR